MATVESEATLPLVEAAKRGSLEEVEAIIAANTADTNAADDAGRTALSFAVAKGHAKVAKVLLDAGATDSRASATGWNAACYAAFGGHAEALSTLVAKLGSAALAGEAATSRMTPLLLASVSGHAQCVSLILDAEPASMGATDAHGRTALILAASGGHPAVIELLVERGAPIDAQSADGRTAVMWAVSAHQHLSVATLTRLGASLDIRMHPNPQAAVGPHKPHPDGESVEDLANAQHARDPTLKHIAKHLKECQQQRQERPGEPSPPMPPLPWVAHAEAMAAKAAAEAAEAEAAGGAATEAADATPAAATGDSDIFGDAPIVDVTETPAPPVSVAAPPKPAAPFKGIEIVSTTPTEGAAAAVAADGDLDDLD